MTVDGSERREHHRVQAAKLLQYKHFDHNDAERLLVDELGMGPTIDLSEKGLAFVCGSPLPVSWTMHLDLALGETIIPAEARIASVVETDDGRYRVGMAFTNISDADLEHIRKIVAERQS